jgi:hypothetical protein
LILNVQPCNLTRMSTRDLTRAAALRWLFLFCLALNASAHAQRPLDTAAGAIRQRIAQEVILRNFSAEPTVHARVGNDGLTFAQTRFQSFSLVQFKKVSVTNHQIVLQGTKRYLIRKLSGNLAPLAELESVNLVVDVDADLTEEVAKAVPSELFFSDLTEALGSVPPEAAALVPAKSEFLQPPPKHPPAAGSKPLCDCREVGTPACAGTVAGSGWAHPVPTKRVDLRMPDNTPPNTSLETSVALQIGIDGRVGTIWMLFASNQGAAISTFDAIRQLQFQPATCHGVPVSSFLRMDNSFVKH